MKEMQGSKLSILKKDSDSWVTPKNLELKGIKKNEFPQDFELLADILSNCILCKDSTYDSISEL